MRITMTDWIHRVLDEYIKEGDCCIDATMGKGGDTYYLCSKTGESGKVYAFDVQADALRQTREKLDKHKMNAELILDGHEHMKEYVKEMAVSCIMFNLGYLPGGDHTISTRIKTSIPALSSSLKLLKKGGLLSLCIYSGGDTGFEEHDAVLSWLKSLDPHCYLVIKSEFYNRPNHPPVPVLVIRLK